MSETRSVGTPRDGAFFWTMLVALLALAFGLPILGVPEALGGISEERSAMAGTLVAEALSKGEVARSVLTFD